MSRVEENNWLMKHTIISFAKVIILTHEAALWVGTSILAIARGQ